MSSAETKSEGRRAGNVLYISIWKEGMNVFLRQSYSLIMSASSKFYDIPPEVIYNILGYIEATPCLLHCALTCKAWLPLAQDRLLSEVELTPNNAAKFNSFADKYPHVYTRIRQLTLAESEAGLRPEVIDSLPRFAHLQQNQVEILRILHATLPYSIFGLGFKKIIHLFSSLRSLECHSMSFCFYGQILDLICASPTLVSLSLLLCRCEDMSDVSTALTPRTCPRLQTVIILLPDYSDIVHPYEIGWQLCNWMASQQPPLPLQALKVSSRGANAFASSYTQPLDSAVSNLAAMATDTLREFRFAEFILYNAIDDEEVTRASPLFELSQNTQLRKLRFDSVKLIITRHNLLHNGNSIGPDFKIAASLSLLFSSLRSTVLEEIDIALPGRYLVGVWDWDVVEELLDDQKFSKLRLLVIRVFDDEMDEPVEAFRRWMPRAYAKGILRIIKGSWDSSPYL